MTTKIVIGILVFSFAIYFGIRSKKKVVEIPEIETQNYAIIEPKDAWKLEPTCSVVFGDPVVGELSWSTGKFVFTGNADESAKVFFEYFLKSLVDEYIEERLKSGK